MKFVASTCSEQLSVQTALLEPPPDGLPAGLLASPCLVQVARGTAYVPVVNMVVTEALLYPHVSLGSLTTVQVVSLPSEAKVRSSATVFSQTAVSSVQDRVNAL